MKLDQDVTSLVKEDNQIIVLSDIYIYQDTNSLRFYCVISSSAIQ